MSYLLSGSIGAECTAFLPFLKIKRYHFIPRMGQKTPLRLKQVDNGRDDVLSILFLFFLLIGIPEISCEAIN